MAFIKTTPLSEEVKGAKEKENLYRNQEQEYLNKWDILIH